MSLLASPAKMDDAVDHLKQASQLALSLSQAHPQAPSLRWEYDAMVQLPQFEKDAQNIAQQPQALQQWLTVFKCDRLKLMHMPAPPPGGWEKVNNSMPFSAGSIFRSLNVN